MKSAMKKILHRVEDTLEGLLMEDGWRSKCIDYTPPIVHRIYRDIVIDDVGYRVYLHRIFACKRAFFHPHPWPSAVRVIGADTSTYEMGIGFSANERHDSPPHAAVMWVPKGFKYVMEHPDAWHYVRILGRPSVSLMVSGPVWDRPGGAPRTEKYDFRPLTEEERFEIVRPILNHYGIATNTEIQRAGVWRESPR